MRPFTPIILGLAALAFPLASPNGSAAGSEGRFAGDHPDSRLRQQQRQERKRLDEQRRRHGDMLELQADRTEDELDRWREHEKDRLKRQYKAAQKYPDRYPPTTLDEYLTLRRRLDTEYRRRRDDLDDYYDYREDQVDDHFDQLEDSLDDAHDRREDRLRHGDRPWQGRGYVPYRAPGVSFGPSAQVPRSHPPHPHRGMTLQAGNGFYLRLGAR